METAGQLRKIGMLRTSSILLNGKLIILHYQYSSIPHSTDSNTPTIINQHHENQHDTKTIFLNSDTRPTKDEEKLKKIKRNIFNETQALKIFK